VLAAVYSSSGGLRLVDRPLPAIGPGEALLRVGACGICGTDMRILSSGHRRIPAGAERILGHELAGEIVAVGTQVSSLQPGQRVALAPNIGCGSCDLCVRGFTQLCPDYTSFGVVIDGGFAEYMRIPAPAIAQGNVVPIGGGLSDEEAALAEPLSCCYHGLTACRLSPGEDVLVFGAGPIGVMHMLLARSLGARRIIAADVSPERLGLVPAGLADALLDPGDSAFAAAVTELTDGKRIDVAIVAAPSAEAQAQALGLMNVHGRVNFFGGLPPGQAGPTLDSNLVHYRELTITGTTGQTVTEYQTCVSFLTSGRLDVKPLVTDRFSLRKIEAAFARARSRAGLKTLVLPRD